MNHAKPPQAAPLRRTPPQTNPAMKEAMLAAHQVQYDRIIRLPELLALTGVGKTSVYTIPELAAARVQLNRRMVGWRLSAVMAWIVSREAVDA